MADENFVNGDFIFAEIISTILMYYYNSKFFPVFF